MSKISLEANSKSQAERFIDTARIFGTDEDEAAFKAKLAVIARQKPKAELVVAIKKEK